MEILVLSRGILADFIDSFCDPRPRMKDFFRVRIIVHVRTAAYSPRTFSSRDKIFTMSSQRTSGLEFAFKASGSAAQVSEAGGRASRLLRKRCKSLRSAPLYDASYANLDVRSAEQSKVEVSNQSLDNDAAPSDKLELRLTIGWARVMVCFYLKGAA